LGAREIDVLCTPDAAGETLLNQAISRLNLSARAFHRVLKVARTIADLAGSDPIAAHCRGDPISAVGSNTMTPIVCAYTKVRV
jgi:predicted ATPase with chaperone activity